jgi:hypothetical protein
MFGFLRIKCESSKNLRAKPSFLFCIMFLFDFFPIVINSCFYIVVFLFFLLIKTTLKYFVCSFVAVIFVFFLHIVMKVVAFFIPFCQSILTFFCIFHKSFLGQISQLIAICKKISSTTRHESLFFFTYLLD